jgi:cytochrome P450
LPFAAGPRGCIGKEFSLLEQKIALVRAHARYRVG